MSPRLSPPRPLTTLRPFGRRAAGRRTRPREGFCSREYQGLHLMQPVGGAGCFRNSRVHPASTARDAVGAAKLSSSGHGAEGGWFLSQASPADRRRGAEPLAWRGGGEGWTGGSSSREGSRL